MCRACRTPIAAAKEIAHQRRAFGENLKRVPVRLLHGAEDVANEFLRHILMEEVAHRIHEDHARLAPAKWLFKPFGPECEIEAVFEWMARRAPEALRETLRIAEVAPSTDLRASRHGIPGRIGPLDGRLLSHALRL